MLHKGQKLIRAIPYEGNDLKVGDIVEFIEYGSPASSHMYVNVIKSNTTSGKRHCTIRHFKPLKHLKRKQHENF